MEKTIEMSEKTRKALFTFQISFLEDLISEECEKNSKYVQLYFGKEMHTHFYGAIQALQYGVYNGKIVYILDRIRNHLVFTRVISKVDTDSRAWLNQLEYYYTSDFYYVDYL